MEELINDDSSFQHLVEDQNIKVFETNPSNVKSESTVESVKECESSENKDNNTRDELITCEVTKSNDSTNSVNKGKNSSSDYNMSEVETVNNLKDSKADKSNTQEISDMKMEEKEGEIVEVRKDGSIEDDCDVHKSFKIEDGEEEFKGFHFTSEFETQGAMKTLLEEDENDVQHLVKSQNHALHCSPPSKRRKGEFEESEMSSHCSSPALSISSQISGFSFSKRSITGSPASRGSRRSNIDLRNPKYLVPFEFGWRREVVTRGITSREDGISKDVYYFHPCGKKLRSLREVSEKLTPGVTIENFTFYKEPLGADPKFETIRNARSQGYSPSESMTPPNRTKAPTSKTKMEKSSVKTPPPPPPPAPKETAKGAASLKNFVKTPKEAGPKPVPPPPPTKKTKLILKFNKGTPKIALKKSSNTVNGELKAPKTLPKIEGPQPHPDAPLGPRRKITPRKKIPNTNQDERMGNNRSATGELEMGMLPPLWSPSGTSAKTSSNESLSWSHLDEKSTNEEGRLDPCTIRCTKAMGLIPTLQCSICLCLYHPECCDMEPITSYRALLRYVCKNCHTKAAESKGRGLVKHITPANVTCDKSPPILSPKPIHPALSSPASPSTSTGSRLQQSVRPKIQTSKSNVCGAAAWLSPTNTVFRSPPVPKSGHIKSEEVSGPLQAIVNINSKRYIVIPKHNILSLASNQNLSPAKADSDQNTTIITPTPTSTIIQGPPLHNNPFIVPTPNSPGVFLVPYMTCENMSPDSAAQYLVVNPTAGSSAISASQPDLPIGSETPDHFSKRLERISKGHSSDDEIDESMQNFMRNMCIGYTALLNVFQYLKVQELLRAGRVCRLWRDIANHPSLWRTVRMKNSQVSDWKGFADSLLRHGTIHLDLRKMLIPLDESEEMWTTFSNNIANVTCLERLDMCRSSVDVIEQIIEACPYLLVFNAQLIGVKDQTTHQKLTLENLSKMKNLKELRMKSFFGLHLIGSLKSLTDLSETLTTLSLTSVKNLGSVEVSYIGKLHLLEALELGECSDMEEDFPTIVIAKLLKLKRIRLEKGPLKCSTNEILYEMSKLKDLMQLELINFDIKPGFDEALASCENIKRLLLIPTYVTQSATTNNIILRGAFKLWKTLTHFVWVVTMELLKVTELFVDQCEGKGSKKSGGNSVPVMKPVPLSEFHDIDDPVSWKEEKATGGKNPNPITVIPIDELFEILREALPNTRVKLLKIPFQNTWRQSITEGSSASV